MEELYNNGFRTVLSHYRNFKIRENPEDIPEMYNFNDFTSQKDLDVVIRHINKRYPKAPIYIVGYSMGAIQGIRWLGEHKGKQKMVKGMVSISCPIDLSKASPYLSQPKHFVYGMWMSKALKRIAEHNKPVLERKNITVDFGILLSPYRQSACYLDTS